MFVAGLTGGIGSGKSAVANLLQAQGIVAVDADQVARDVELPGEPALAQIAQHFGSARDGYPFGTRRMLRERRLRDWLELLSFDVDTPIGYCHTLPLERFRRLGTFPRERWAQRWMPILAGGYLLCAQKRTRILTPIRPVWKQRRLRVVGGLVEPTTRASRTRADG
jgi:hypothetical protein